MSAICCSRAAYGDGTHDPSCVAFCGLDAETEAGARPIVLHVDSHELAKLIAESVREVLDARGVAVCKMRIASVDLVDGQELEDLLREIGLNTAACAAAIDTNPENQ